MNLQSDILGQAILEASKVGIVIGSQFNRLIAGLEDHGLGTLDTRDTLVRKLTENLRVVTKLVKENIITVDEANSLFQGNNISQQSLDIKQTIDSYTKGTDVLSDAKFSDVVRASLEKAGIVCVHD